jgi:hypothetical protein
VILAGHAIRVPPVARARDGGLGRDEVEVTGRLAPRSGNPLVVSRVDAAGPVRARFAGETAGSRDNSCVERAPVPTGLTQEPEPRGRVFNRETIR